MAEMIVTGIFTLIGVLLGGLIGLTTKARKD